MTKLEKAIARQLYDGLMAEAKKLSLWDMLSLKKAYAEKRAFDAMPAAIQEAFGQVAVAVVVEASRRGNAP